jgi:nitrogen fixation/metabolism regulation signal transduction histidine kinase
MNITKRIELEWKILILACLLFFAFAWPLQLMFADRLELTLRRSIDPDLENILRSQLPSADAKEKAAVVAAIERHRQWRVMMPLLIKEQRQIMFAFSTVFFVVMVVGAFWTLRRLTRPLKDLAYAVTRIGKGTRTEVAVTSGGALGTLEGAVSRLQEELVALRKQAQLQGMEKAWQDIARVMAHEIKNPLTPIRLTLDRMEEKAGQGEGTDAATTLKFLNRINEQVDALERLVNQFRSFSREPEMRAREVDVAEAVRAVSDPLSGRIATTIKGSARAMADPYLLSQVFLNIWKNAMESGATAVIADILTRQTRCVVSIHDNGPGIAQEHLESVWLPYVSFKKGGTGLGLPVVKKLMETMGGAIELHSQSSGSERGCTFIASLPPVPVGERPHE